VKRLVVGFVVVLLGAVAAPSTGSAHTGFDYSLPTQDASVADPISEITVAFTEPVTLVGNGFEVLNPQGEIVLPTPITDDDRVFRLILDPAIAGGEVGVRYEVTSVDGHVVAGGFSFVVDAPLPTTTVPTTTTTTTTTMTAAAPATTAPAAAVPPTAAATYASTTVVDSPTPASTATGPTSSDLDEDDEDDEPGSNTGISIAIAAAVAVAGVAFVVVRGRTVT
jgi:methionine-rich copper-binding protein CopC